MTERVDGHEAYRDDAEYTAPEMQPGNGEDISPGADPEFALGTGAALTGAAGAAFAGEILVERVESERANASGHHG